MLGWALCPCGPGARWGPGWEEGTRPGTSGLISWKRPPRQSPGRAPAGVCVQLGCESPPWGACPGPRQGWVPCAGGFTRWAPVHAGQGGQSGHSQTEPAEGAKAPLLPHSAWCWAYCPGQWSSPQGSAAHAARVPPCQQAQGLRGMPNGLAAPGSGGHEAKEGERVPRSQPPIQAHTPPLTGPGFLREQLDKCSGPPTFWKLLQ